MRALRAHRVLARRVFVFIIFAMVHRQPRPNDVGGAPRRPPQTAESGHPTLQLAQNLSAEIPEISGHL